MKSYICTLGCKVNQYESGQMQALLEARGVTPAKKGEQVDIYIINSCTVTATADQKTRQTLHKARREHPGAVVCLTGCMPQAAADTIDKLDADVILGTSNRNRIWECIERFLTTGQQVAEIAPPADTFDDAVSIISNKTTKRTSAHERTRAYLKIEDGCDRFCSYCVIPHSRGRVRSRPLGSIRDEAAALAGRFRELVLVGINLSAYGQDAGLSLLDAVEAASGPDGIVRLRLGSLEPDLLTGDMLGALAANKKLCPQFHLSLQSGCDGTLRRMNRRYTTREYAAVVEKIRALWDNPAITTDIMAGFPGETDGEFETSLNFVREIGFAKMHCFVYSRRPSTAAADMPDQIPPETSSRRAALMLEAAGEMELNFMRGQIGRGEEVLVERHRDGFYHGYSRRYCPVRIAQTAPDEINPGEIIRVRITGVDEYGLLGEYHYETN